MNFGNLLLAKLPQLGGGGHPEGSSVLCAMEMVAFINCEPHSDHPQSVDSALGSEVRQFNDALHDHHRQMLWPFLPRMIGTSELNSADGFLLNRRFGNLTNWMHIGQYGYPSQHRVHEAFHRLDRYISAIEGTLRKPTVVTFTPKQTARVHEFVKAAA